MRRILVREFGGPDVLRVDEAPTPKPAANEVLVRVRAAGVNPVETYMRAGTYARKPPLPYVPGADGAGEVEAVGAEVRQFKPGDRVYIAGDNVTAPAGAGTYSEYCLCVPTQLHPLPDRVTFSQGAALGIPYVTAWRALFMRAGSRPGETLLVNGATGGVGIAAVQMGRAHGMRVIGTGGTDKGLDLVRTNGADAVVNHRDPGCFDQILKATDGKGADVILEMAAHVNLDKDLSVLARHGRVVVIGSRGRVEIDPRGVMARDAAILGMLSFNISPADLASIHAALVAGLANGTLSPVVGREFPLDEAPRAHEAVLEAGALGKIVLTP
jgi:NADPH2:quinone reductase